MAVRPGQCCVMNSSRSIGAQRNFAATFNWLVSCLQSLKGGKNVTITGLNDGKPVIDVDVPDKRDEGEKPSGEGKEYVFKSAQDANVIFTTQDVSDNQVQVTVGVYYL